jgi:hypothetical protein
MRHARNRNNEKTWRISLLILLISWQVSFPQVTDTILKIEKGSYFLMKDIKHFISSDTIIEIPSTLNKGYENFNNRTIIFYDSLKSKAYKTKVTRTIYDLVIVKPKISNPKSIDEKSDEFFLAYSGFRIRNVSIRRLNVFGTDLNNPGFYEPKKGQGFLNQTHVNTIERIIKGNLLFSEGDTVSPLTLTDNERILRQLPYIDDAKIIVVPVSDTEADIVVVTKDVYSLGGELSLKGKIAGVSVFEKNILGLGHEIRMQLPFTTNGSYPPGIGLSYKVNNISRSFINLNLNYYNALGMETLGGTLTRNLISSETKYAGGISIKYMFTTEDLDTLPEPVPLKFTYQDYWLQRSFMLNKTNVSRIIVGGRYINNNILQRPEIRSDTYYSLQNYKLYLGSLAYSRQKYYRTSLVYGYGRTEDIPYGFLLRTTGGIELNEFKKRYYIESDISFGTTVKSVGYFYMLAGYGSFINDYNAEQAVLTLRMRYFSNLLPIRGSMVRNFLNVNYTRGIARYEDEYLKVLRENGFAGFRNDSLRGGQRVTMSFETVFFSPYNLYGFKFAFFGFADMSFLAGTHQLISNGTILSGLGIGIRLRNENLVFNTLQVRIGYYPNPPAYSDINALTLSGEQPLRPSNFEPGPPAVYKYQ